QLKLDNSRILDIHYPANKVIALLLHNDYVSTALSILATHTIKPLENFDPCAAVHLRAKEFVDLSEDARQQKMTEIHKNRLLKVLAFLRPTIRPAVARQFVTNQWLTYEQIHDDPSTRPIPHDTILKMTLWNANGCARHTIQAILDSIPSTHLLFLTETWLLSPLRFLTNWTQYHTYATPVANTFRGEMGVSLLVNPNCPYPVTHFPSASKYVLSCQVRTYLIHCVYLPPALPDQEAIEILHTLPTQTHVSQTNTIICGDLNARHRSLLGDTRTTPRGSLMHDWIVEHGLTCWNSLLAYGIPTYHSHTCTNSTTGEYFHSVIDLFISTNVLHNPRLVVHDDLSLGSDYSPISLHCLLPRPTENDQHPRILWNLSRLAEPDCTYSSIIKQTLRPLRTVLNNLT
ncbi:Endonuclease/exonuclease/phosphatase, partial [Radiomyces spectabilis]|uniref:Endonuclease/exonuclease/phosphatase n=1 Tax=Radiomyces spectabilis TaxID=64574 RepID=UPI00221FEEA6